MKRETVVTELMHSQWVISLPLSNAPFALWTGNCPMETFTGMATRLVGVYVHKTVGCCPSLVRWSWVLGLLRKLMVLSNKSLGLAELTLKEKEFTQHCHSWTLRVKTGFCLGSVRTVLEITWGELQLYIVLWKAFTNVFLNMGGICCINCIGSYYTTMKYFT